MKVAFIPPKGLESHMIKGDMVMGLAQLATAHDDVAFEYVRIIQELSANRRFVIVDNGANENVQMSYESLEQRATYLGASELVMPDVLGDANMTFLAVAHYLKCRKSAFPSYMGVVHGVNVEELRRLVNSYSNMYEVTTLGLPRLLLKTVNLSARIDLANWVQTEYAGRFDIHLLGASSLWVREPYYVMRYAPHIRSIDTSLPYNYGLKGINIADTVEPINRPANYFTEMHEATGRTTIFDNEEVYKSWCSGDTHLPTVKSAH